MADHPEHAVQSLLIFRSVLPLVMALTVGEAPAENCRLHLLDLQLRWRSWVAAILYHLRCCCFRLDWAHTVHVAIDEEIFGYSKPELMYLALSSI